MHKLDDLTVEKSRFENVINTAKDTPEDVKAEVKSRCERAQLLEHELSKTRQQQKFARIVERKKESNTPKKRKQYCIGLY